MPCPRTRETPEAGAPSATPMKGFREENQRGHSILVGARPPALGKGRREPPEICGGPDHPDRQHGMTLPGDPRRRSRVLGIERWRCQSNSVTRMMSLDPAGR